MASRFSRAGSAVRPRALAMRAAQLLFAALLLLGTSHAFASDTKVYMGSFCTPMSHALLPKGTSDGSAITNASDDSLIVLCPIVKSVYDNSKLDSVKVETDLGGNGNVSCNLAALNAIHPGLVNPLESVTKQVSGSSTNTLSFSTFGNSISGAAWQTSQWRYYELTCTMSSWTRIKSYTVVEQGNAEATRKIYPASMCHEDELDTDGGWFFHTGHWLNSSQIEVGSVTAYVCPIITDRTGNTSATQTAEIAVGNPINNFRQLTCTLVSNGTFTGPVDQRSATIKGLTNPEFASVALNLDINTSKTWGNYFIRCNMDGSGDTKLYSYRIRENG